MKGIKVYLLIGLVIAVVVALSIFMDPIKAASYTSKMSDFKMKRGESFQTASNGGIEGFVNMKTKAVSYLVKNLKNDNEAVRIASIIALGKISPTDIGGKNLVAYLKFASDAELPAITWALAKHKKLVAKSVIDIFKKAKEDNLKIACCKFFAKTIERGALKEVIELLSDPSFEVASVACSTIQSIPDPSATYPLIELIKRAHAKGKKKLVSSACSTILFCTNPSYLPGIFEEMKSNEIPALLEASRNYAKRLPNSLEPFIRPGLSSKNKVERESALIIAKELTPNAKVSLAKYTIGRKDATSIIFGLNLVSDYGTENDLARLEELIDHSDNEVASGAIVALGKIISRIKYGSVPSYGGYKKENPRERYINMILKKMEDKPELLKPCHVCLKELCVPRLSDNVIESFQSWSDYWNEFIETRGMIKSLVEHLDQVTELLQDKSRENMVKAKKIIDAADKICSKLEEIAEHKTSIARWIERKRKDLNQLMYTVNKCKPLDVMN